MREFSQCGCLLDLKERVSYFQQVCQKVKLLHFIVDHLSVVIRVALCSYNIFLHGVMTQCFFFKARGSMEPHIVCCTISFALLCVCLHSCMFQALICVLCCVFHPLCVLRGWMEAAAREVALHNTICFALLCVCCAVCFAPLCVSQCERLVGRSGCKGSCIT